MLKIRAARILRFINVTIPLCQEKVLIVSFEIRCARFLRVHRYKSLQCRQLFCLAMSLLNEQATGLLDIVTYITNRVKILNNESPLRLSG